MRQKLGWTPLMAVLCLGVSASVLHAQVTLSQWQSATSGAGTLPSSNVDGDLWDDLMEFALGSDPQSGSPVVASVPSRRAGLALVTQPTGQVDAMLWRPADRSGISYELETSADLVLWTSLGAPVVLGTADGGEIVTWADVAAVGDTGFARLKISLAGTSSVSLGVPLGWSKVQLAAGTQSYAPTLLPGQFYTGCVLSVGGSTLAVQGPAADDLRAMWPVGASAYLEFTEGPAEGHRIDVVLASSTAKSVALNLGSPNNTTSSLPAGIAGARFVLRAHETMNDVFGKDLYQAGSGTSDADNVMVWQGAAFQTFYLAAGPAGTPGYPRWVLAGDATTAGL